MAKNSTPATDAEIVDAFRRREAKFVCGASDITDADAVNIVAALLVHGYSSVLSTLPENVQARALATAKLKELQAAKLLSRFTPGAGGPGKKPRAVWYLGKAAEVP
jgi:hypothetical protein